MPCPQVPMEETRSYAVIPLPNPGEGGPTQAPENGAVTPLPDHQEGGAVDSGGAQPVIPLPNPGEGGPTAPNDAQPLIPLPDYGEGGPAAPFYARYARVRFLNASYGYPAFRIFIGNARRVDFLSAGSITSYGSVSTGYQTVTVTGTDGYIYLQKTLPFEAGTICTVAVINRAGGLDLLQISDLCCAPSGRMANFRVSNLAYNSGPLDVMLTDGRVLYADVRYKETTAYKRIRPGAYQMVFAETGLLPIPTYTDIETLDSAFIGANPMPDALASLYVQIRAHTNCTVFLLNNAPEYNAITTLVVQDG